MTLQNLAKNATSALLCIVHFSCILQTLAQNVNPRKALVPAVLVFGDSIVDTGNNNGINTFFKSNFPPYGKDFDGHVPTGRFSNGRIATDFIVSKMGVKDLLPPYLASSLSPEDLLTGVSFASGGTGYDPITSQLGSVISMTDQLEMFKDYKKKLRDIVGVKRGSKIIGESLYIICAGSNDIANTYFGAPLIRSQQYDIPSYANEMLTWASNFIQELIKLGAKKIGVVGIPPIGCVPSQRFMFGGIYESCAIGHNQIATLYNQGLSKEIQIINNKNQGTKMVYVGIYDVIIDMVEHPNNYGFQVSTRGCCGSGLVEASYACNALTSLVCQNVSNYLFWDSVHPTEKAYEILVDWVVKKYLNFLVNQEEN